MLTAANQLEELALSAKATWLLTRKEYTPTIEVVTPELAKDLLTRNTCNRAVSQHAVAGYAKDMGQGNWKLNGEAIVLTDKGVLRSGQHRLLAVILANTPIKMAINCGVEDDSYTTLDSGRRRTAANVLDIEGFKYAATIAGGIREFSTNQKGLPSINFLVGSQAVSNNDILKVALALGKGRLEELAAICHNYNSHCKFLSPAQILGFVLTLEELHPTKWMGFMDKIFYGIGIEKDTPEFWFAARARKEANTPTQKTPISIRKALFIKAFNAYLSKKQVSQLKFNAEVEKFPRFIGAKSK
jgi:hypothetical protein